MPLDHAAHIFCRAKKEKGGCFLYHGTARRCQAFFRRNIHLAHGTNEPRTLISIARWDISMISMGGGGIHFERHSLS